jgi:Pyruvate/2-oxoacid:ferredoxin oxidoreductase delta subunit
MAIRNIIQIDEEKCNGCGQCVVDCAEAALQVVNGKAKIVKEMYCDGLGACMGGCPTGALTIVQKEADAFDEAATERHVHQTRERREEPPACPGVRTVEFSGKAESFGGMPQTRPELSNWPVQLKLVPANAPFLNDSDLLLAADCTAFSAADFHSRFMKGKKLLIACPKLDGAQHYHQKLVEMFRENSIKSITVVRMEVPCCGGLMSLTKQAIIDSGKKIPFDETVIGVKGNIVSGGRSSS